MYVGSRGNAVDVCQGECVPDISNIVGSQVEWSRVCVGKAPIARDLHEGGL